MTSKRFKATTSYGLGQRDRIIHRNSIDEIKDFCSKSNRILWWILDTKTKKIVYVHSLFKFLQNA